MKRALLFLSLLSIPACAQAQQDQAQTVLSGCSARARVALPLLNFYAEGSVIPADSRRSPGSVIYKVKGLQQIRTDFSFSDQQESIVINSGRGRRIRNSQSKVEPAWATGFYLAEQIPSLFCYANLLPGFDASVVGNETMNGKSVVHIEIHKSGSKANRLDYLSSELHLFIDPTTLLVVKLQTWAFSPQTLTTAQRWRFTTTITEM